MTASASNGAPLYYELRRFVPATDNDAALGAVRPKPPPPLVSTEEGNAARGVDLGSLYMQFATTRAKEENTPSASIALSRASSARKDSAVSESKRTEKVAGTTAVVGSECAVHELSARERRSLSKELFGGCEEGDVDRIRSALFGGASLSWRDAYGWSPLMCASAAGQREAVEWLLATLVRGRERRGRKKELSVDETGDGESAEGAVDLARALTEAADVARRCGHVAVAALLESASLKEAERRDGGAGRVREGDAARIEGASVTGAQGDDVVVVCDKCGISLPASQLHDHRFGTAHLHACGPQEGAGGPSYAIAPTNIGYRLLVQSGWERERGLGPAGEGRREPVRTVLKRDRKGLGRTDVPRARVTHFDAGDVAAVAGGGGRSARVSADAAKPLTKRQLRERAQKERAWEDRMRRYFAS